MVEVSEAAGVGLVVPGCVKQTSLQVQEKWGYFNIREINVNAQVDEITFVEQLLLESVRFHDDIAPSTVDALEYQYVRSWQVDKNHVE